MEATSRPMLEPLTDLPIEEPAEGAQALRHARNTGPSGEAAVPAKSPPGAPAGGDELIDPEALLGASEPPSVVPEREAPAPAAPCLEAGLELVDPELDMSGLRPVLPRAAAPAPAPAAEVVDRPAPEFR